jgi:hypothetical protein
VFHKLGGLPATSWQAALATTMMCVENGLRSADLEHTLKAQGCNVLLGSLLEVYKLSTYLDIISNLYTHDSRQMVIVAQQPCGPPLIFIQCETQILWNNYTSQSTLFPKQ